jgi:hypothetical protein
LRARFAVTIKRQIYPPVLIIRQTASEFKLHFTPGVV